MIWLFVGGVLLTALAGRRLFLRGPLHPSVSEPPRGIIDMHCHTAGIGAGDSGAWISDEMRNRWKFGLYLRVFGSNEKTLAAKGDALLMEIIARSIRESEHVDGAVILAMDAPHDADGNVDLSLGEVFVPSRFVGETVKAHPELHFGASVHPNRADAIDELQWSKDNGAVFVKWLPNIQAIDPSEKRHIP